MRVARPGARLVLIDNVVPGDNHLADFVNHFERVRDPSHNVCYPLVELTAMLEAGGLGVRSTELLDKPTDFEDWTKRMRVPDAEMCKLRAMLPSPEAAATIRPETIDGVIIKSVFGAVQEIAEKAMGTVVGIATLALVAAVMAGCARAPKPTVPTVVFDEPTFAARPATVFRVPLDAAGKPVTLDVASSWTVTRLVWYVVPCTTMRSGVASPAV